MRIIDAHEVQLKLLEECQNIRHFDKDREKPQIFADGLDFAWVMLDNAPTIDAIPIKWLIENAREYFADFEIAHLDCMITDWRLQNEID